MLSLFFVSNNAIKNMKVNRKLLYQNGNNNNKKKILPLIQNALHAKKYFKQDVSFILNGKRIRARNK